MTRKLKANVYVGGVLYPADQAPPAEVAAQITNPKAWGDEPDDEGSEKPKPAKKAAAKRSK